MTTERKTYASRPGEYRLDSARVFGVVADLGRYLHFAQNQAKRDNSPEANTPSSILSGNGRTLRVRTEVVNQPWSLTSFDLAELVLADDNSSLILKIREHPSVAIPSEDLHSLAVRYLLRK